jgi:hypothetical protein
VVSALRVLSRVPPIFLVVPGILAGIFVPAVIVGNPKPAPPNTVGMTFMDFAGPDTVYIHRGQYLTFVDSSRNIHDIGPGQNGLITTPVRGEPVRGFHRPVADAGHVLRDLRAPPGHEPHDRGPPLTRTVSLPTDHSRVTLVELSERRETMRSSVKHLRYVLGSLSAVLFSAAAAQSV